MEPELSGSTPSSAGLSKTTIITVSVVANFVFLSLLVGLVLFVRRQCRNEFPKRCSQMKVQEDYGDRGVDEKV